MALFAMGGFFASCEEEMGTTPGGDGTPVVTIYQYATSLPNNPDNDTQLRFVFNNASQSGYYLCEPSETVASLTKELGEDGYIDRVVSEGSALTLDENRVSDVLIKDLMGEYTITAVAVKGNKKVAQKITFTGLQWETVAQGELYIGDLANLAKAAGTDAIENVEMQICTSNSSLYRLFEPFAKGYSIKFNILKGYEGVDDGGSYKFFRVPSQQTGLQFGDYGDVSIRDIGYWQGNDAFVTDSGYESGLYEDYSAFFYVQAFVDLGNLGYQYLYFTPAE